MKNKFLNRLISLVLVISTLLSFSGFFSAYASSDVKKGYINDDNVFVRKSPTTTKDNKLKHNGSNIMLDTGHEVSIIETVDSDGDTKYKTWHHIKFKYDGIEFEGYVYADFVRVVETPSGDIEFPEDAPEIYKEYIENLAKSHPNWTFKFYDTGIEWSTLISDNAQGDRKKSMIYKTFPLSYRSTESGCYNWATDTWIATDSGGWYHANDKTIFHYMDPRNFLNDNNIFMFEALSYDEKTQTIDGVEKILKGTFMEGKLITDTNGNKISYAQAYIDAAIISGVSPFHLASRTVQEVGTNGSGSTSGTYPGYGGYYNYYNIMAVSGSNPIAEGLKYASGKSASSTEKSKYNLPWDSPYKAIVGGAKWIGNGYINNNQDTLYYQKFNVVNKNWNHQYMANITAPATESVHIKKTYSDLGILDHSFTFIIPYFRNMPSEPCQLPVASNASPNNWLSSLSIEGYNLSFDAAKTTGYSLSVSHDVSSVNISAKAVNSKSTIKGVGKCTLKEGINHFNIVVTAENGDVRTYSIEIIRGQAEKIPLKSISLNKTNLTLSLRETQTLTVSFNPVDTTDDKTITWLSSNDSVVKVENGKVTAVGKGEAIVTAKVGNISATCKVVVTGDYITGDVNNDGKVTAIDARNVLQYAAGTKTLNSQQLKCADVNNDGKVTAFDARKILQMAAEI